jgi:hypothetical protein
MRVFRPTFGHHFFVVHSSGAPSDTWLNVALGVAAILTAVGFIGGLYLAIRYGRKVNISVSGVAYTTASGIVVAARPIVHVVGVFRIRFAAADVTATEVYINDSGKLEDGRIWTNDKIFGLAFVEGGETLGTTSAFILPIPLPRVIGWRLSAEVATLNRLSPGTNWSWSDQVFVPKPTPSR